MPEPNHNYIHPNIIKDSSAGEAGVIAGELIAEEEDSIGKSVVQSNSYGSIQDVQFSNSEGDNRYAIPKAQLYTLISSLFMASYLAALDVTVVTTMLSTMASELHAVTYISWIPTAYLLSCSAFQPLFGKLSDIFGRKSLLIICCGLFALGCFICATDSLTWLIIGRFVTGCGGSGLTTLGTITMSDLIPLRDRGVYQGMANVFYGLGAASGGILGGIISDLWGWKYVFILQVPLALAVGIAIWLNLNLPDGSPGLGSQGEDMMQKLKRVDFVGSFFLVLSIMCILLAASFGGTDIAYSSKSFIGLCGASILLLACFMYAEVYISEEPIIPLEIFAERTILASSLTNWFYTMGVFTYLFYVPIYFSSVLGFTATQCGERLIPNFLGISLGSVACGLYMKKTGRYYNLMILVGIMACVNGIRMLTIKPDISVISQYTLLLPSGLSYSSVLTVTLLALIAAVPSKFQACTTSIQYTFRSTGSTLGVAIASAIFQGVLKSSLVSKITELVSDPNEAKNIIESALESANYSREAPKYVQEAIRASYALAYKGSITFSVATIILGFISSLFMKEHKLHSNLNRD